MKKSSTDLHQIIRALARHERRYFRIYAARYGRKDKNSQYLKLFGRLSRQKEYNEPALKRHFGNGRGVNYLPQEKKRLEYLLMRALNAYHACASVDSSLAEMTGFARILNTKALFGPSMKILKRAKKIASEGELFLRVLEIISLQKGIITDKEEMMQPGTRLDDLIVEEQLVTAKWETKRRFENIRHRLFRHFMKNEVARNAREQRMYRNLISDPLCASERHADSFHTRLDYCYIYSMYYFATGNLPACYRYRKKALILMESLPVIPEEQTRRYISILNNLSIVCLHLKKYDECRQVIEKIRRVPRDRADIRVMIFRTFYTNALDLALKSGAFEKGIRLVSEVTGGLQFHGANVPADTLSTIYFNIAYLYFGVQRYHEAARWLHRILNEVKEDVRTLERCHARLLLVIVYIEFQDWHLVDYYVRSAYRYLYKTSRLYGFEKAVVRFIRDQSVSRAKPAEMLPVYRELKAELEKISRNFFEKKALDYFDYISWLESKISHRPFAEILRKKAHLY